MRSQVAIRSWFFFSSRRRHTRSLCDWSSDVCSSDLRLYRDFLAAHDRVYGHSVETPAKIVNIRTVHQARGSEVLQEMRFDTSGGPVEIGRRDILVAGEAAPVTAIVYDRDALREGFRFSGPAIVQQSDTTTLVEPGWDGLVDDAGNLILTRH